MAKKKTFTIKIPDIDFSKERVWMMASFVFIALSLVLLVRPQIIGNSPICGYFSAVGLNADEAGTKSIDYINTNLVQDGGAEYVSSEETINGMYKVTTSYQGSEIDVYITKDGRWLFLSEPVDTEDENVIDNSQDDVEQVPTEVPKTDTPEAHAFVMSYCPYGLQFLKAYIPVIELLGDEANLDVNFVNYIMHGEDEIQENSRMYCIQKEQPEEFTEYLRCFVVEGDYDGCMEEVGIDVDGVVSCMDSLDETYGITELYNDESTWRNGVYPPYPVENELNEQYSISGSPTFILNGERVSVSRSAESIKEAICNAFNNPPEECEQSLSSTAEEPSFGAIGAGAGNTLSDAQC